MDKIATIINGYILEGIAAADITFNVAEISIKLSGGRIVRLYPMEDRAELVTTVLGDVYSFDMTLDEIIEGF